MVLPTWITSIVAPSCGSLLSFIMYIAPYKSFRKMEQSHNVGESSIIPMIVLHINSIMWVVYGYIQENHALIPINSIGTLFTLWYILMYYSACDSKTRKFIEIMMLSSQAMALIWTAIAYYALPEFGYQRDLPMGIACIIPNIGFYAAPLLSLAKVVKTKSTASLSFPITCSSFACAFFWSLFGIGIEDAFVLVPNLLGVAFSMIQLILFAYYGVCMKNLSDSFTRIYKRHVDHDDPDIQHHDDLHDDLRHSDDLQHHDDLRHRKDHDLDEQYNPNEEVGGAVIVNVLKNSGSLKKSGSLKNSSDILTKATEP